MTPLARNAVNDLSAAIERERRVAECPCVRALLVILSNGLARIAEAEGAQRDGAPEKRR